MTPDQWRHHEDTVCFECAYYARGRCPVPRIMRGHPDDYAAMHLFRNGRCSQWSPKTKLPA